MATIAIIIITSLISILSFYGILNIHKLIFNAYEVWHRKRWYKLFSSGLVHGGWGHLIFNMLTLYFFGPVVEGYFTALYGRIPGMAIFAAMYISAIAAASLWDLFKYRNDYHYNALGASGAISAVLFSSILFQPTMGIYMFFIPIPIPGYIFAPLYLLYCWYMAKKNLDNIGHSAHFWGALYGVLFTLAACPGVLGRFLSSIF